MASSKRAMVEGDKKPQGGSGCMQTYERLKSIPFGTLLVLAFLLRLGLLAYGIYHDARHALKYTDVDYYVFSDAAKFVLYPSSPSSLASGPLAQKLGWKIGSPYSRATYRYTPLLALLLLPNELLHPLWGKILFSIADIAIGAVVYRITQKSKLCTRDQAKLYISLVWLFNPMIANISTRGSSESVLGVIVLSFLALAMEDRWDAAAAVFGLAVHFKLYPVIYASAVLARLASRGGGWINSTQVRFAVISATSFMLLNVCMFAIWGHPFVEHTFLYHLTRLDHRHNFSHHFYPIYLQLSAPGKPPSFTPRLSTYALQLLSSSFLPQLGLTAFFGLLPPSASNRHLPFTFMVQTLVFTTFNRVCTSQYFLWYLFFLPLCIPSLAKRMSDGTALVLFGSWAAGQGIWLAIAYYVELEGAALFRELWAAGLVFFLVNIGLIGGLLDNYAL